MIYFSRQIDVLGKAVKFTLAVFIVEFAAFFTFTPAESVVWNKSDVGDFGVFFAVLDQIFDQFFAQCRIGCT